jgi:hypothetical protein
MRMLAAYTRPYKNPEPCADGLKDFGPVTTNRIKIVPTIETTLIKTFTTVPLFNLLVHIL